MTVSKHELSNESKLRRHVYGDHHVSPRIKLNLPNANVSETQLSLEVMVETEIGSTPYGRKLFIQGLRSESTTERERFYARSPLPFGLQHEHAHGGARVIGSCCRLVGRVGLGPTAHRRGVVNEYTPWAGRRVPYRESTTWSRPPSPAAGPPGPLLPVVDRCSLVNSCFEAAAYLSSCSTSSIFFS